MIALFFVFSLAHAWATADVSCENYFLRLGLSGDATDAEARRGYVDGLKALHANGALETDTVRRLNEAYAGVLSGLSDAGGPGTDPTQLQYFRFAYDVLTKEWEVVRHGLYIFERWRRSTDGAAGATALELIAFFTACAADHVGAPAEDLRRDLIDHFIRDVLFESFDGTRRNLVDRALAEGKDEFVATVVAMVRLAQTPAEWAFVGEILTVKDPRFPTLDVIGELRRTLTARSYFSRNEKLAFADLVDAAFDRAFEAADPPARTGAHRFTRRRIAAARAWRRLVGRETPDPSSNRGRDAG